MRKVLTIVACLGMMAVVANANDLHIYLGTPVDTAAFVADDGGLVHPVVTDPVGEVTYGVWAEVGVDWTSGVVDVWNGIAVDYMATGGVTVVDSLMNNDDHNPSPLQTAYRWEDSSDFGGTDGFFLVAVTRFGLGGLLPADVGGTPPDMYAYTPEIGVSGIKYWLGNITLACDAPGDLYFGVGSGGIARQGGDVDTDLVYFGSADGMRGDAFGEFASAPMLTCIPEPASLLLLGLAGLVLRRR
jgi:hypothetical protein